MRPARIIFVSTRRGPSSATAPAFRRDRHPPRHRRRRSSDAPRGPGSLDRTTIPPHCECPRPTSR